MDIRREYSADRVRIAQTECGEWWCLLLEGVMGEWERTAYARSLRGVLEGDHLRCFEQFHATGEEREMIAEWRRHAVEN